MSVASLAGADARPLATRRLALAALAVALVGGAVALALWWATSAVAPPSGARHPFGMGIREAAPAAGGLGGWLLAWQSQVFTALRGTLASIRDDRGGAGLLLGIGFAYGVFHAAGPGHGKAIIAGYIVASERAVLRATGLSAAAALIQALVAIALVSAVFILAGGTAATMARTANAVEITGFCLVAALGLVLVWRKAGKLALVLAGPAPPGAAGAACGCAHVDPAETGRTWGQMAAVALGAGIRPCAGALVVLTLSRTYGMFAVGIAATLAMAAGTALTTGGLALLSTYAKRLALRLASRPGRAPALLGAAAELAAAAFVLVVGTALLAGWWDGALTT